MTKRDGGARGKSENENSSRRNETAAAPRLRVDQIVDAQIGQRLDLAMIAARRNIDDVWNGDDLAAGRNGRAHTRW